MSASPASPASQSFWGVHVRSYDEVSCGDYDTRDLLHYPQGSVFVFRSLEGAIRQARHEYASYLDPDGQHGRDFEDFAAGLPMPLAPDGKDHRWYDTDNDICVLVYRVEIRD